MSELLIGTQSGVFRLGNDGNPQHIVAMTAANTGGTS